MTALLQIHKMTVSFSRRHSTLDAIKDLNLTLNDGETLGLVGESGSGKSLTSLAIMDLQPQNCQVRAEQLRFNGIDIHSLHKKKRRQLLGNQLAMIFQDPLTSLNPCLSIGYQMDEVVKKHLHGRRQQRRQHIASLLEQVGIGHPQTLFSAYPHQLSGGMCQRIMIAMAIACEPRLLIADEPTTALDVTIQDQILKVLRTLKKKKNLSILLITHDMGVVAEMADRIAVMYGGRIVEMGPTSEVLSSPYHPYTQGLLSCLPEMHTASQRRLHTIPGTVSELGHQNQGCQLSPRCQYADQRCRSLAVSPYLTKNRMVVCHKPLTGALT